MIIQVSEDLWINDRYVVKAWSGGGDIMVVLDHSEGSPARYDNDPWVRGEYADRLRKQWGAGFDHEMKS